MHERSKLCNFFKPLEVRIGSIDVRGTGRVQLTVNAVCGTTELNSTINTIFLICDSALSGRYLTTQATEPEFMEIDEIYVCEQSQAFLRSEVIS